MTLRSLVQDWLACVGFFTRLPVPAFIPDERPFGARLWAAPLAGVAMALAGWLAFFLAQRGFGLSQAAAALLALAATMLATGCLHEDGLADTVDGFGGGRTRERKLAIMRDSRIGTFGVAALFVSLGLRWTALAALPPFHVLSALLAAHGASRALLPAFLRLVPPARSDGLGAGVGLVPASAVLAALPIGAVLLLPLGLGAAFVAAILLALLFFGLKRLAERQIGGQTGDVCGALQQGAEAIVMLAASRAFA